MRLLVAEARAMAKPISVNVVEFNPASEFYERAGFRIVGKDEHKLYMWHDGG